MPSPLDGQELRRHPFGLVRGDPRQTAEIDRIELHRADIEELASCGLAATWATIWDLPTPHAPQICRGTRSADQRMQRFQQSGGFHRITFRNGEYG